MQKALTRRLEGTQDHHIWRSVADMCEQSGLKGLLDRIAPEIDHDITTRKCNNMHSLLDITSTTAHCISAEAGGLPLIGVVFFAVFVHTF